MARMTTKLGKELTIGDRIVYDESFLGRPKVAPIRAIYPTGGGWLRLALAEVGDMPAEADFEYTVVA